MTDFAHARTVMVDNQLETQIASYQRWRDDIRTGIEAYQAWLDQQAGDIAEAQSIVQEQISSGGPLAQIEEGEEG